MAGTPTYTTPPSSPHANWSTAPLLPRKSPERLNRRLALGHKSTQSLNLPRNARDTLPKVVSPQGTDGSVDLVGQALLQLQLKTSSAQAGPPKDNLQRSPLNLSTPEFPSIVSPRPRRHTDLRALENSHESSKPSADEDTPRPVPRKSRLETSEATTFPVHRHIRGARSMSPQRNEQFQAPSLASTFRHDARQQASHGSPLALGSSEDQVPTDVSNGSRFSPQRLQYQSTTRQSPEPDDNSHPGMQETASPNPPMSSKLDVIVPSEDDFEGDIRRGRSFALSCGQPNIELDWACDVVRLTDRKQLRQLRLTDGASRALSLPLYDLQQEAVEVIQRLCSQGIPRAQYTQGVLLEFGKSGSRMDRREAFRLYKDASKAGFARADYRIGMQFEKTGDMPKACENYERGAGRDDVACLYRLGMLMLQGLHGYAQNEQKAISCIHLSALSADADAPQGAYVWALLLAGEATFKVSEDALKQDVEDSVTFFEKAAHLGFSPAQLRLGKAHEFNELDCEFSPAKSVHYYTLAALGDSAEGDMALSKWFLAGSEDGTVVKDEKKAFFHAELAARRGLASAEFALGYFYEVGVNCDADLQRAQAYYRQAAGHGSEEAKSRIEGIARAGTMSRKEHEYNVSTQIRARHATIKLNQKEVDTYRRRARSNVPMPQRSDTGELVRDDSSRSRAGMSIPALNQSHTPEHHASTESRSMQAEVEALDVADPRNAAAKAYGLPTRDPQHDRFESEGRREGQTMQYDLPPKAIGSTPVPSLTRRQDHMRGQSSVSQAPRWTLSDVNVATPPAHAREQSVRSFVPPANTERVEQEQSHIQTWNQQNAAHSYHGSPNLAPSELGSAYEVPYLSSPRPESSVSNVPPFRLPQSHVDSRQFSNTASLVSQATAPVSVASSAAAPSTNTSISGLSHRRTATTFEEMGIPVVNKKKEDCVLM